jgi:putative ABC transport system permease protein
LIASSLQKWHLAGCKKGHNHHMLKNYFIIAVRHLTRHKLFSAINVFCLGIGIAFSMLIGNYIMQEKNVNLFLRHADNQYLIKSTWKVKNMGLAITTVAPLAKALKENYPALVENYYRFNPFTNVVSAGEIYVWIEAFTRQSTPGFSEQ